MAPSGILLDNSCVTDSLTSTAMLISGTKLESDMDPVVASLISRLMFEAIEFIRTNPMGVKLVTEVTPPSQQQQQQQLSGNYRRHLRWSSLNSMLKELLVQDGTLWACQQLAALTRTPTQQLAEYEGADGLDLDLVETETETEKVEVESEVEVEVESESGQVKDSKAPSKQKDSKEKDSSSTGFRYKPISPISRMNRSQLESMGRGGQVIRIQSLQAHTTTIVSSEGEAEQSDILFEPADIE